MAIIGTFKADKDGYTGEIRTLVLNARVRLVANDRKDKPGTPDFRVLAGQTQIGAAWRKTWPGTEESYLTVKIDDPALPHAIWGALMESTEDGVIRLLWRRPNR